MRYSRRLLTHASTLALLGALGSLGAAGTASAALLAACDPSSGFVPRTGDNNTSQVISNTTGSAPSFNYDFTVCNTSGTAYEGGGDRIYDWELPYDPNAGIDLGPNLSSIARPAGWGVAIETRGQANSSTGWEGIINWQDPMDPMYIAFPAFRMHTEVLHWFTCQEASGFECNFINPGEFLGGFGFTAPLGPTNGPYQASWQVFPPRTGDPDVPAGVAGFRTINDVPEPAGLALFALGLGALMAARRRKVEPQT